MKPKVFFTKKITPEKVVELYDALGIDLPGKVAVKVHSGRRSPPRRWWSSTTPWGSTCPARWP